MAVILFMREPELDPVRYAKVMADLELDANPPAGLIMHLASEWTGAIDIVEVWQTPECAESYVANRLWPVLQAHRVKKLPAYRIEAMQNLFAAQIDVLERLGSTSRPHDPASARRSA